MVPCFSWDLLSVYVICFAVMRTGFQKLMSSLSSPASRCEWLSFTLRGRSRVGRPSRDSQGGVGVDGALDSRSLAC